MEPITGSPIRKQFLGGRSGVHAMPGTPTHRRGTEAAVTSGRARRAVSAHRRCPAPSRKEDIAAASAQEPLLDQSALPAAAKAAGRMMAGRGCPCARAVAAMPVTLRHGAAAVQPRLGLARGARGVHMALGNPARAVARPQGWGRWPGSVASTQAAQRRSQAVVTRAASSGAPARWRWPCRPSRPYEQRASDLPCARM